MNIPLLLKNTAGLWLLLLLPVIAALYLLKLRRAERLVSSTFLWRKMVQDMEANAPWQKLRRNLLLVLQLLFLGFLIFSIARPAIPAVAYSSQTAVLILDTSASMAATDVQPNRLEAARRAANQVIEELPANARISIISAGEKSRTVISLSADRRAIRQAIANISLSGGGCDLGVALQIARAIAERQTDGQTVVISDGNVELPDRISIPGLVRFIPIGDSHQNQAIELLNLHTNPGNHSLSAFAQTANYSDSIARRRLAFYADDILVNVYDLDIPPNSTQSALADGIISTTRVVEARLLPDGSSADDLPLDDVAYAISQPATPATVTLISQGNLFLETALKLLPNLELNVPAPGQPFDPGNGLVIYDGMTPNAAHLPAGNLLFIAPPTSTQLFTVTGILQSPESEAVEPLDPLIEQVKLDEINILDSQEIAPPDWARVILADANSRSPLLLVGEAEGRRIAILAFDLHHSDFPLQVGFPVLISNLINWLSPGSQSPRQATPGATIVFLQPLTVAQENSPLTITRPDGKQVQIDYQDGKAIFSDTGQTGIYTIASGNGENSLLAINLFSPQESRIAPKESLPLESSTPTGENRSLPTGEREIWRITASLALALLTIEWLVYQRATLTMLARRIKTLPRRVRFSR